ERSFVSLFGMFLLIDLRVDDLGRAGSRAHVGIGAFNLVRRDASLSIGGHERLRLEVADDLKLGLVLRRSGVRQGCAACARRLAGGRGFEGLLLPFAGVCLALVALTSALSATLRGAVIWRGTRYRLRDLQTGGVRDADWPPDRAPGAAA